jgi:hypothetical protein
LRYDDDAEAAVSAVRSVRGRRAAPHRRRRLSSRRQRAGLILETGEALTAITTATLEAALDVAAAKVETELRGRCRPGSR